MDSYAVRLADLVAAADDAYRRARAEIYDVLPVGVRIDLEVLSPSQRDAFENLIIAEAELANYRHSQYEWNHASRPIAHAV